MAGATNTFDTQTDHIELERPCIQVRPVLAFKSRLSADNFSRAADERPITQPALGQRVRAHRLYPYLVQRRSGLCRVLQGTTHPALNDVPIQTVLTVHLTAVLRTLAVDGRSMAWPGYRTPGRRRPGCQRTVPDAWCFKMAIALYRTFSTMRRIAWAERGGGDRRIGHNKRLNATCLIAASAVIARALGVLKGFQKTFAPFGAAET